MATFYASYPISGGSGGVVPTYASLAVFPSAASAGNGSLAIALDTNILYESDGASWLVLANPSYSGAITALTGDVTATGPGSVAATIANLAVTNAKIANATIDLTAKVTGVLPVANGGTNSNTALNNNRVIQSSGGKIVEASAITASRALASDANGIPVASATTATELGYVNGVTSAIQTQLNAKAIGPGTSVDNEIVLFNGVGGETLKRATGTGVVHATSGVYSASAVVLTSEVSGTLPVANGGTNSATALNSNRFIISSGGAVVENSAVIANRALASDSNGLPVAATTTATELDYVNGVTSAIQTQLNGKQASGNYITALTGDVTAAGPGSVAATLATVNTDVGTFGDATHVGQFTVNGKGLVTAASNVLITAVATMNGNVRASEGGGTITLTVSDNQTQTWSLSAGETVKLPTTSVAKGDIWVMINPSPYKLTIQSSGANTILTSWGTRVILQANVATPTAAADWTILETTILYGRKWTTFTVTVNNLGTIANDTFGWMRVGPNMLLKGSFDLGTPSGAAAASINLPSLGAGINIDISPGIVNNKSGLGAWAQQFNAANAIFASTLSGICDVAGGVTTSFRLTGNTASFGYEQGLANAYFTAGTTLDVGSTGPLVIPIAEWAEV